jgi:MFS family permease
MMASESESRSPFRALRHRDFRLLWLGLVGSAIGTWMQIVGQALLVLKISHGSALALGAVSLAQALAFFVFALLGGAVADHVDKRRLLLFTQAICMALTATLGVLTLLDRVHVWMVVLLAFLQGTVLSFDQPTRGALVPELVPKEDLLAAISLQSFVFTGASAVGPALAGLALPLIGFAGIFFANSVSYVLVLGALFAIHVPKIEAPTRLPNPRAIFDALAVVRADAALPLILFLYGSLLFLGPSPALLLPVLSLRVLHLDPQHLGILFAASGVGTVVGGLGLASTRDPNRKTRIVIGAALFWCVALGALSASQTFAPAVTSLFFVGTAQVGVSATSITLLQTRVPPQMRGRVMSLNTLLVMGVRPLGDFAASAAIDLFGPARTAAFSAALVAMVALFVASRKKIRSA